MLASVLAAVGATSGLSVAADDRITAEADFQVEMLSYERFDDGMEALRERAGYQISGHTELVEDETAVNGRALRIRNPPERDQNNAYFTWYFPVEPGERYRVRARMRSEDVSENRRGAVVFAGLKEHDRSHVYGGSHPQGRYGSNDWWVQSSGLVPEFFPMREDLGYIGILIGVEGTGTVWVDEVVVERVAGDPPGPKLLNPSDEELVHTRRPQLSWRSLAQGRMPDFTIELSRTGDFSAPETQRHRISAANGEFEPPMPLETGLWHWRVREDLFQSWSRVGTFEVASDADPGPIVFEPRWTWQDSTRPTLEAVIEPADRIASVEAQINGQSARIVKEAGSRFWFQPAEPLDRGAHEIRVEVTDVEGEARQFVDYFANHERPERISFRDDGLMRIDGEPFFPIGALRDPSDSFTEFDGLLEAGFNITKHYDFEIPYIAESRTGDGARERVDLDLARQYLRNAHEAGLKTYMGINRHDIRDRDAQAVRRWAAELAGKPGLTFWYLFDEPEWYSPAIGSNRIRWAHRQVKAMAPGIPTTVLNTSPWVGGHYARHRAADIPVVDPYPIGRHPLSLVTDYIREIREHAWDDQPVWAMLQAFDWGDAQRLREGEDLERPTASDLRCMSHQALAEGAQGLFYYWYPHYGMRPHLPTEQPHIWANIVEAIQQLRDLEPFLTARRTLNHELNLPEPLVGWSSQVDGRRVYAIANPSQETIGIDTAFTLGLHEGARDFHSQADASTQRYWEIPGEDALVLVVEASR